jgi:hypothetical protein
MQVTHTSADQSNRRRFLKLTGGTLLGSAAITEAARASIDHFGGDFTTPIGTLYTGGVVSNPDLPGAAGELILNVYLAVDADGKGVGTLSDTLHSEINCHLDVREGGGKGNTFRLAGVVRAAKDASLLGQHFVVTGVVTDNFTSLALQWEDAVFLGKGFAVSAPKFTDPISTF